ncbi:MAG: hypothetical protein K2N05_12665 [Muribaculaceae bacterium]|nr:hypothetical protein [Muribaculaceae bacterium]
MKKTLLFSALLAAGIPMFAQTADPVIVPEFYSSKISPDGKIIASYIYDQVAIYNVDTKEITRFEDVEMSMGNGNCITKDGRIIVGFTPMDQPVVIVDGVLKDVDNHDYEVFILHGITGDGSRAVGIVLNSNMDSETMYEPFYVEVSADGTVGKPNILPYPKKDWLGTEPQYCSAVWISNDGKTILGQVKDNSGMAVYPIVYTEKDGEWSYSLPSESLINPNKLPYPEAPEEFNLQPVEPTDFMTPEKREAYEQAMADWAASGYDYELYPSPAEYMTDEEIEAYNKAADEYNEAAIAYNEKVAAYFEALQEIMNQSVFFFQNGFTMNGEGTLAAMSAEIEDPDADPFDWNSTTLRPTYMLDLTTGDLKDVSGKDPEDYPLPRQILSDGTVIGCTPEGFGVLPVSYVMGPKHDGYVDFPTYLATVNPAGATWLKENFTKEIEEEVYNDQTGEWDFITSEKLLAGSVVVSDDWSVVSAGIHAYIYSMDVSFESYVIFGEGSGIESVASDASLVSKKYYDLNGLEVKDPSNGIYVERAVYSDGSVVTTKTAKK